MTPVKEFVSSHFEAIFVFIVVIGCGVLSYFIDHKLAFLNFYYLPVIMGSYYLGKTFTLQGTVLIILSIIFAVIMWPEEFVSQSSRMSMYIHVILWASFLLMTGASVAKLQESLQAELARTRHLLKELEESQKQLADKNTKLANHSDDLEAKVFERTKALEESKKVVEELKFKAENALYSTMDASVAKLLIEGKLRNEKKHVTVMFSDIKDFTTYSEERRPEQVIGELNEFLGEMEPIILAFRGHIDKYLGDGIMVEFGAPIECRHHRLMALVAGMMMQKKLNQTHSHWNMRIGLCSGYTIMGIVGNKRSSYTTIGDVVNIASRIENMCSPGSIYFDEETRLGVEGFLTYRKVTSAALHEDIANEDLQEIESLQERLSDENIVRQERLRVMTSLGQLWAKLGDTTQALSMFEQALLLDPESDDLKIAFAEATMKKIEEQKHRVKGRKKTIEVYELTGIADPLMDSRKYSRAFVNKYRHALEFVTIPQDVILPIESLEGALGHSTGMAIISYALAQALGVPEYERKLLVNAAYLSDIGKEIVPHHLLNRSGSLTDDEYLQVIEHAVESARIMKRLGYDHEYMIEAVTHSHEHFDGTGRPKGLAKDEIPLSSRIIAVADAYDAMVSWRTYRDRWDPQAAMVEMEKGVTRGLFDPTVVSELKRILLLDEDLSGDSNHAKWNRSA